MSAVIAYDDSNLLLKGSTSESWASILPRTRKSPRRRNNLNVLASGLNVNRTEESMYVDVEGDEDIK